MCLNSAPGDVLRWVVEGHTKFGIISRLRDLNVLVVRPDGTHYWRSGGWHEMGGNPVKVKDPKRIRDERVRKIMVEAQKTIVGL